MGLSRKWTSYKITQVRSQFCARADFDLLPNFPGNLIDWWEPITKERYLRKAQCIIQQYGNYTIPHLRLGLNGINTQGENIADNGGIKEAYQAYGERDLLYVPFLLMYPPTIALN